MGRKKVMTPTHIAHCIKIIKALNEDNVKNNVNQLEKHDNIYEYNEVNEPPKAKDALFMKAKVARQNTYVMIDTGVVRSVVSKKFLDKVGLEIDAPPNRILIGVSGKVTTPL